MKLYLPSLWLVLASASAFAPAPVTDLSTPLARAASTTALGAESSRRDVLRAALAAPAFLAAAAAPAIANAADSASYAAAIEKSTNALSKSLGHALACVDGMNAQAARLGSSPHPAHPVAVLEGMQAQARRLTRDLDSSVEILETMKGQANAITINDEKFSVVAGNVAHASSVLDGLVAQSRRLEGALASGGSAESPDDQIIYMLSVLDGLNAQVRRLDAEVTFTVLDELNAKAAMALL